MDEPPLKLKDFRLLVGGIAFAEFALQIQSVIVGWQVYEIKHDPLYLGIVGLVEAVPALSIALFSGHIVDRSDPLKVRKNVLWLMLLSAVMLLTASCWIQSNTTYALAGIYTAVFFSGVARAFDGPSIETLVPKLVPRDSLPSISAWTTSALHLSSVAGPALGGLLYVWKGASGPYIFNCVVVTAALIQTSRIHYKHEPRVETTQEPVFSTLLAGFRYVSRNELLLSALALDMFGVLFGGATALLPIFADTILHVGPVGLGVLRAAPAIGALAMSAVLIRFPLDRSAGKILLWAVTGFGLSIIGFGLSKSFILSVCLLGLTGAFDSVSMVIRSAMVRLCSPDPMRGRISAVNSIFIGSSNQLGALESGVAAKLLGTVPSVVVGGCLTLVTIAITAIAAPALRKMNLSDL